MRGVRRSSFASVGVCSLALGWACAALASETVLAPPLATVDDPRADRARERLAYLAFDKSVASFVVVPRHEPGRARVALLLAFPTAPARRPVPPGALHALADAIETDAVSLEERAPLLAPLPLDPQVRVLGGSRDAVRSWLAGLSPEVRERLDEARLGRLIEAGWTFVGIDAPSPSPPVGFRFESEHAFLPPDLLAPPDEVSRLLLLSRAPSSASRERGALDEDALRLALSHKEARPALALVAADREAALAGRLLTPLEEANEELLDVSRFLDLTGEAVAPALPLGEPDALSLRGLSLALLHGDLDDERSAARVLVHASDEVEESAAAPRSDARPLVRRLERNRVFRLLQKVWGP